jgi:hypothetical protein
MTERVYVVEAASDLHRAKRLIEQGWDYVCQIDRKWLFRKEAPVEPRRGTTLVG